MLDFLSPSAIEAGAVIRCRPRGQYGRSAPGNWRNDFRAGTSWKRNMSGRPMCCNDLTSSEAGRLLALSWQANRRLYLFDSLSPRKSPEDLSSSAPTMISGDRR